MEFAALDAVTITAIVSAVLGPGGVFFLLVRKAINGSAEAIHRVEQNVVDIRTTQTQDHDSLTSVVGKIDAIKAAQEAYHPLVNQNTLALARMTERCDLLHRDSSERTRGGDPK